MKMQDVRNIARNMDINTGAKRTKQDLIRDIQAKEGNIPCYKTRSECPEMDCLWRDDCLPKK
ncbi:MAG: SAP domain-containing protein [Deltaproteobacteria bacterium]|nr:SAP domain-containing protein [Deltaproteobacteria bacterium]